MSYLKYKHLHAIAINVKGNNLRNSTGYGGIWDTFNLKLPKNNVSSRHRGKLHLDFYMVDFLGTPFKP
jgi:hypothetical protein